MDDERARSRGARVPNGLRRNGLIRRLTTAAPPLSKLRQCLAELDLRADYSTESDNILTELYRPCLARATRYDRAVGYFRASVYREMSEELLDFVMRGGKIRLVCSPDLPPPDEEAAREGYDGRGNRRAAEVEADLLRVIKRMAVNPDERDCLEMLRLLVEEGCLDLYIAERPSGIYHRKLGAFHDVDGHVVLFAGSGNETPSGVAALDGWGNDEEFDVYRSWGQEYEQSKVSRRTKYLDELFAGGTTHTRVRRINEVEREALAAFRAYTRLEDCRPGARKRTQTQSPVPLKLYYYQEQAIAAWQQNGCRGMLSMATGLGKTITALSAIRQPVLDGTPVLILVPSAVLLNQWERNIRTFYPDVPLMIAGGPHDWRGLATKRMFVSAAKLPRIILATMQTAASADFREFIQQARGTVLVVDEAHRLGAPTYQSALDIPRSALLGLSATPERLYDTSGTSALERAFGIEPVFNVGIGDSVHLTAGDGSPVPVLGYFLCPYFYDFDVVPLDTQEQASWQALTDEIRPLAARLRSAANSGKSDLQASEKVRQLYIRRARIAKNAGGKVALAARILKEHYPTKGHWIVYCDNASQLDRVAGSVREALPHVTVLVYHSGMTHGERERVLKHFEDNPSIVIAIRCLDEGIDVPRADGAVILASSANPREYIQRRGRVLRQAKGKERARIVDAIVLPSAAAEDLATDAILRSELARAYGFARHALNVEVMHRLWRLCNDYGIDPNEAFNGLEEDEEEEKADAT